MPATREYTQFRRITMQVVLCAALGLTVGVAWWMGRAHAEALAVRLGPPQRFAQSDFAFDVRLPQGWSTEISADESRLVVTEPEPRYGAKREMHVAAFLVEHGASIEQTATTLTEHRPTAGKPRELKILGAPALLFDYPPQQHGDNPNEVLTPFLFACAIIPGPQPHAVYVSLHGYRTPAPADFAAILSVAQALAWPDPAHPAPPVSGKTERIRQRVR